MTGRGRRGPSNSGITTDALNSKVEEAVSKAVEGVSSEMRAIREALAELTNKSNDSSSVAQLAKEAADAAVAEQLSQQQGNTSPDGLTTPRNGVPRPSRGLYKTLTAAKKDEARIACLVDG